MKKNLLIFGIILPICACTIHPKVQQDHRPAPQADQLNSTSHYYTEKGIASWYGEEFHQKPTASGETYDMYAMTAAHKTLPLGTWVTVTDLETRKAIRVRINDRGPFIPKRIIDLSYKAAETLGIVEKGTAYIELQCPFSESFLQQNLGYWVQLGAYSEAPHAEEIAARLKKHNFKVQVLSSNSFHRVRLGPFQREDEAYRTCDLLRRKGMHAFVIRDLMPLAATAFSAEKASAQEN